MPLKTEPGTGSYVPVAKDEAESTPAAPRKDSLYRKICAPIGIAIIASVLMYSQLQLAFETRYEYDYDLTDLVDGGEGETYSYNLWHGVQQLWQDGAPLLALVVLCWSGLFPYVKLLLIGWVDYKGRTKEKPVSEWWNVLSVLAKWSFLDVWVVAMTVLVVRININHHQDMHSWVFSKKLKLKIWTQAVALRGCFLFAFSLIASQFLGHFILRRAIYGDSPARLTSAASPRALMHQSKGGVDTVAISVCSFLSLVGMFIGLLLPFLHLEYHFDVDVHQQFLIDEHIDADIIETYSIIDAIWTMGTPNHIRGENYGMTYLMLAFVAAAPILRSLCGVVLWFVPLKPNIQGMLASIIDTLSVVAAADVFSATAFLMIWQLPKLFANMKEAAEYMVLTLEPRTGLFFFAVFGLMDTFVSNVISSRYMEAAANPPAGADPKTEKAEGGELAV